MKLKYNAALTLFYRTVSRHQPCPGRERLRHYFQVAVTGKCGKIKKLKLVKKVRGRKLVFKSKNNE